MYREEHQTDVIRVRAEDLEPYDGGPFLIDSVRPRYILKYGGEVYRVFPLRVSSTNSFPRGTVGYVTDDKGLTHTIELHRDDWPEWTGPINGVMSSERCVGLLVRAVRDWRKGLSDQASELVSDHDLKALVSAVSLKVPDIVDKAKDVPEGMFDRLSSVKVMEKVRFEEKK